MPQADRLALALAAGALTLPETGRIAVFNAAPTGFLDALPAERVRCEQAFRPVHDAIAALGLNVAPVLDGPAAAAVVTLTRNRAESLGMVARALTLLPPGGTLAVNGAKTDGIDAVAKQIAAAFPLDQTFVKAHGRLVILRRPAALPPVVAFWAEAAAPVRNAAGFLTAAGMFSPEGPDPGSARLAAHLDPRQSGRVAELGAGWGWLGHAALGRCPAITMLDLFEADARALDAARSNVSDPRAAFHWADVTALGTGAGPFDAVLANPPFHAGRAAEPELGRAFLRAAARILRPSGQFWLVANRQLPYEATLDALFITHRRLFEDGRYKVILAERPRRR